MQDPIHCSTHTLSGQVELYISASRRAQAAAGQAAKQEPGRQPAAASQTHEPLKSCSTCLGQPVQDVPLPVVARAFLGKSIGDTCRDKKYCQRTTLQVWCLQPKMLHL